MKPFADISLQIARALAVVMLAGVSQTANAVDVLVIRPNPGVIQEEVKAADRVAEQKQAAIVRRLGVPICYPTIYPNPLAFNMTWVTVSDKTFAQVRALANRQKAKVRRIQVAQQAQPNPAAQKNIQQQMRKLFVPMLTSELSFAARATDLNPEERRKLAADGKAWFEKFLVDYVKKLDPNQQQMLLQGMQGVWFGNQRQKTENPRDGIRAGVAKLVKETLSKEKVAAYTDECQKREDFARQVSVDNLVERIDEKVKLSPDQWKKITKSLNDHWEKSRDPQLEAFAINHSMWPGAPDRWVLPDLSPAQQAVLKRINNNSGQMFINGGVFGQMFGGDIQVMDDMNVDVRVEVEAVEPAAAIERPEAE